MENSNEKKINNFRRLVFYAPQLDETEIIIAYNGGWLNVQKDTRWSSYGNAMREVMGRGFILTEVTGKERE